MFATLDLPSLNYCLRPYDRHCRYELTLVTTTLWDKFDTFEISLPRVSVSDIYVLLLFSEMPYFVSFFASSASYLSFALSVHLYIKTIIFNWTFSTSPLRYMYIEQDFTLLLQCTLFKRVSSKKNPNKIPRRPRDRSNTLILLGDQKLVALCDQKITAITLILVENNPKTWADLSLS